MYRTARQGKSQLCAGLASPIILTYILVEVPVLFAKLRTSPYILTYILVEVPVFFAVFYDPNLAANEAPR